jgi:hypothetical protein
VNSIDDPPLIQKRGNTNSKTVLTQSSKKVETSKCPYCEEVHHEVDFDNQKGDNKAVGPTLRGNMYPNESYLQHPHWYEPDDEEKRNSVKPNKTDPKKNHSLQAHHLISKAPMNNPTWKERCKHNKYDINNRKNGVMLPAWITLACQLGIPLHKGGHDFNESKYTDKVNTALEEAMDELKENKEDKCARLKFIEEMNKIGKDFYADIMDFELPLTKYAEHYHPSSPQGCSQISDKAADEIRYAGEKYAAIAAGSTGCGKGRGHGYTGEEKRAAWESDTKRELFNIGS